MQTTVNRVPVTEAFLTEPLSYVTNSHICETDSSRPLPAPHTTRTHGVPAALLLVVALFSWLAAHALSAPPLLKVLLASEAVRNLSTTCLPPGGPLAPGRVGQVLGRAAAIAWALRSFSLIWRRSCWVCRFRRRVLARVSCCRAVSASCCFSNLWYQS